MTNKLSCPGNHDKNQGTIFVPNSWRLLQTHRGVSLAFSHRRHDGSPRPDDPVEDVKQTVFFRTADRKWSSQKRIRSFSDTDHYKMTRPRLGGDFRRFQSHQVRLPGDFFVESDFCILLNHDLGIHQSYIVLSLIAFFICFISEAIFLIASAICFISFSFFSDIFFRLSLNAFIPSGVLSVGGF